MKRAHLIVITSIDSQGNEKLKIGIYSDAKLSVADILSRSRQKVLATIEAETYEEAHNKLKEMIEFEI